MKSMSKYFDDSSVNLLQLMKLVVYSLLLINFVLYIRDDWVIASYTMRSGGSLLNWTRAYAATIDEAAWIVLLVVFELETFVLSDEAFTRKKTLLMRGTRLICYGFIGHSLYAYGVYVTQLNSAVAIPNVTDLCELIGPDVSFAFNLLYIDIENLNCTNLSTASQFYYIDPPNFIVVTDGAGLIIEIQLAWIDFLEVVVWLLILLTIEVIIRLQDRDIVEGILIRTLNLAKILLYGLLWVAIVIWLYYGQFMFAWDEMVWIAGFVLIETNVVKWRQEIIEDSSVGANKTVAD